MMNTTSSLWQLLQIQLVQISLLIVLAGIASHLLRNRHPHIVFALWAVVFVKCLTPPLMISSIGLFAWQSPPSPIRDIPYGDAAPVQSIPIIGHFDVLAPFTIDRDVAPSISDPCRSGLALEFGDPVSGHSCRDSQDDKEPGGETVLVDSNRLALSPSIDNPATSIPVLATSEVPQSPSTSSSDSSAVSGAFGVRGLLVAIWLAGMAAFGMIAVLQWLRCWLTIRKNRIQPDSRLLATVDRVKRRLGFRRTVRLVVNDSHYGPMVFGYFRPVLVLPLEVVEHARTRNLELVIAHELIHVRRGDTLLCLLQFGAQAIWWFNPLVRWASRTTDDISERCCDLEVVRGLKCKPSEYVRSLLGIIEMRQTLKYVAGSAGLRSSDITFRRLKWLAGQRRVLPSGTPWTSWLIASVTAILVFPGAGSSTQQEHPKIKNAQEAIASRDEEAHSAFQKQDWETASKNYRSIVEENPDSSLAWFRLGYALHQMGDIDEALIAHEKAASFADARRSAMYNWACALAIKGDYDGALDKLTAAIDAGYSRSIPLDEDEDLAPLRDNERFRKLVERHKEAVIAQSSDGGVSRGMMSTERGSTGTSAPRIVDTRSLEQLSFWHGTWKVTDADGKELGSSVVALDPEKYVIVETWTGLDGSSGTGESLYDSGSSLWIQKFQGSNFKYNVAGSVDGSTLSTYGDVTFEDKRSQECQTMLTRLDDGRLQQTMKVSGDKGISWETRFTRIYVRTEAPPEATKGSPAPDAKGSQKGSQ